MSDKNGPEIGTEYLSTHYDNDTQNYIKKKFKFM